MGMMNVVAAPARQRRRVLMCGVARLGAGVLLGGLVGCAGGWGPFGMRELTFTEAELQALVERHAGGPRRVAELFELTLARPQVRLQPERNRIASSLDISVQERLSGQRARGHLALEHTLRFEPVDATLRLADVRVQSLQLDAGAGAFTGAAARVSGLVVEHVLEDMVVWRASESQRDALRQANVRAADIRVTARGLTVRFIDPA